MYMWIIVIEICDGVEALSYTIEEQVIANM